MAGERPCIYNLWRVGDERPYETSDGDPPSGSQDYVPLTPTQRKTGRKGVKECRKALNRGSAQLPDAPTQSTGETESPYTPQNPEAQQGVTEQLIIPYFGDLAVKLAESSDQDLTHQRPTQDAELMPSCDCQGGAPEAKTGDEAEGEGHQIHSG